MFVPVRFFENRLIDVLWRSLVYTQPTKNTYMVECKKQILFFISKVERKMSGSGLLCSYSNDYLNTIKWI